MTLKNILFFVCLSLCSTAFAANIHTYPNSGATKGQAAYPRFCEIEIINHSRHDVRVFGVFDDGTALQPFTVYDYDAPHYISLFYYGYCHDGMDLYISTLRSGYPVYSGYTPNATTVYILPGNMPSAELKNKA